jgi:hypothetical protein
MKKPSLILLLFVYTCSQLGSVAWYYYKPIVHALSVSRQRLRAMQNKDAGLVSITVDTKTYNKIKENGDEVHWNGVLHDIEKVVLHGNNVHLLLRKDLDETRWLEFHKIISNWFIKTSFPQKTATTGLLKFLLKTCIPLEKNNSGLPDKKPFIYLSAINTLLPASPYLGYTMQPPDFSTL